MILLIAGFMLESKAFLGKEFILFCLCFGTRDRTHNLLLARQAFCLLSQIPGPRNSFLKYHPLLTPESERVYQILPEKKLF